MAQSRIPGITCSIVSLGMIDSGTLCRTASPKSGPVNRRWLSLPLPPAKEEVLKAAAPFLLREEGCPVHPYVPPGDSSGVTIGVGWDLGQHTETELVEIWADLPTDALNKLKNAIGKTGQDARSVLKDLQAIKIPLETSQKVFTTALLPTYYDETKEAFPGFDALPMEAQVALISLVYNRGSGMEDTNPAAKHSDPKAHNRLEMREIREAVQEQNLFEIARLIRSMERIWAGTTNEELLTGRREREANLIDRAIMRIFPLDISPFAYA